MKASVISTTIAAELQETLAEVNNEQAEQLAERIVKANRVFLIGAGRSLLMIKCCAMRLMQMGLTAYVPGEVVTPSIQPGDLLLVASGSGETGSVVLMAKKAKAMGAEVALITMVPESTIGSVADTVITIKGNSPKAASNYKQNSIQIGGGLFEISVLLFLEAIVLMVVEKLGVEDPNKLLMQNHANLE